MPGTPDQIPVSEAPSPVAGCAPGPGIHSGVSGIADRIKSRAIDLGFALCGITDAEPPPHHQAYRQWLDDGCAGEMKYLREMESRRGDIGGVVAGARSVVVVAMNYYTDPPDEAGPASGVVARYARFDDYHQAMWSRLNDLLDFIKTESPGASGRAYCDTGPISERDLAMRAGIGWVGKHTNLINRNLGNWFFLGEVIVDIDLTRDTPATAHCGTCFRCAPACPTGAIAAPYRLDARRCISYLTIEIKGAIPPELRPLIGNRIYGCDDCLEVCPWNKFAVRTTDPAFQPRSDLESPELIELLGLDDDSFRARFRASPIRRTKRRGLLRNVCVAIGNVGDESALPALSRALDDPEPLIREHAAWAIEQIEERTNPHSRPPSREARAPRPKGTRRNGRNI